MLVISKTKKFTSQSLSNYCRADHSHPSVFSYYVLITCWYLNSEHSKKGSAFLGSELSQLFQYLANVQTSKMKLHVRLPSLCRKIWLTFEKVFKRNYKRLSRISCQPPFPHSLGIESKIYYYLFFLGMVVTRWGNNSVPVILTRNERNSGNY